MAFELDERDLIAVDADDDVETIDDNWLEPADDTVIDTDPEATDARITRSSGYPPGLGDDEVHALVGRLTRELCGRPADFSSARPSPRR